MARRLLLAYVTLIAVVLLVLEVPLGITFRDREVQDLRARVQGDAVALASFAEDGLEAGTGPGEQLEVVAARYTRDTGGRVVVVDTTGQAIVDTEPLVAGELRDFSSRPEVATALHGQVASGSRPSDTLGHNLLFVAVPVASGGVVHGAVRVTFPTSAVDARVQRNWVTLGVIGALTLATATVVGLALARWVARPLRDLEQATTALGRGALDTRSATGSGPPEVRRLAGAVNEMAARLEELVGAQEAFVADASHQLRTPLTSLRLRLELLETELAATEGMEEGAGAVSASLREVARLSRLVDGLLALARAERTGASGSATTVELRALLEERAEAWQALAEEEGVRLEVEGPPTAARATPDRLAQVLDNLIANAVEAAPAGSALTLRVGADGGNPELHVLDRGPGLPEEARARAFDRFWSGNRPSRLGGSGLGLAIVRKLVEADGGTVELRGRDGAGLDATVRLAAAPGPPLPRS